MSVLITFSAETEQKLRERASQSGLSVEGFVQQLVEREVLGTNGSPAPPLPSDAALAPFRREVEQSGATDEELRDFLEVLREEVYQEQHGRPSKTK